MPSKPDVAHAPATAVGTTVLAVLAAIASLASSKSASQALAAKNQAILAQSRAGAAQDAYESHVTREHVYEAALATARDLDRATLAKLAAIARDERNASQPFAGRIAIEEQEVAMQNEVSTRYSHTREEYDDGATLLEIAIAIVSISALTSSLFLVGFGAFCGLAGFALSLWAFVRG
jgi:hypothetical protein